LIHPISFLSAQMFSSGHGNPLCIHSAVDTVHRFAHDLKKILLHWLATETKQKSKKCPASPSSNAFLYSICILRLVVHSALIRSRTKVTA
jgi:hypothetical protein